MWEFSNRFRKIVFSFFVFAFAIGFEAKAQSYYWETPRRISRENAIFPRAVSNGVDAAIFWQEVDASKSVIYLSAQFFHEGRWRTRERFAGPFPYSGEIPDLYSAAMNQNGTIALGVLSDTDTISIYTSSDFGEFFSVKEISRENVPLVAPRIYSMYKGGFIIFTSLGKNESFTMLYSRSRDGIEWNNFEEFSPATGALNPFLPVLLSTEKGEVVIFQAQQNVGSRIVYRLFLTTSRNSGASWSRPKMISAEGDDELASDQRPTLCSFNGQTYVAWERTPYNSENSHICFAALNTDNGTVSGRVERITNSGNASRPFLFTYDNALCLVWFDTRSGSERVYFCQRDGFLWGEHQSLSSNREASMFAYPIITGENKGLSFIWQTGSDNRSSIYRIEADRTVMPPTLSGINFSQGRSRSEDVKIRVTMPEDSSGIRGFSWIWTQDPNEYVPEELMNLPRENTIAARATADSHWYLKARALDYAGNWSSPAILDYCRDLTPPLAPVIEYPMLDESGFVKGNSFTLRWKDASIDEEIDGYSYRLEYHYSLPKDVLVSSRHPASLPSNALSARLDQIRNTYPETSLNPRAPQTSVQTRAETASFSNLTNGVYTFSVRSFDTAGNMSQPSFVTLYINKYEPYTTITSVRKSTDIFGNTTLDLNGLGFLYDGTISKIIITRQNAQEPFSLELNQSSGDYRVLSDSRISGIKLDSTIPQGTYTITIVHTDRGPYELRGAFSVQDNGTVKIAPQYEYKPLWKKVYDNGSFYLQLGDVLLALIMLIALIALIFAIRGLVVYAKQASMLSKEINALFTGDVMPLEKKKKVAVLTKRGMSLRVKLVSFTAALVIAVSLLVSVPLGYIMTRTQESTLASGLEERVKVLLASLSSGVRAYMPTQNVLELSALPSQSSALPEANFVTITGLASGDETSDEVSYVWASNDKTLSEKTGEESLSPGVSRLSTSIMLEITSNFTTLNKTAYDQVGEITANIAKLNAEGASIVLRNDAASIARREEISVITTQLSTRLDETLNEISVSNTSSYPAYNNSKIDRDNTDYIFYRPVLYRMGSSQTYVRGIVFLSVSTEALIQTVEAERRTIIYMALLIALLAVLIGTIGAWILASIIVGPVKRLAAHVEMIGATVNKEKLAGKDIIIKSRDEIGQLGDAVNAMTQELVRAALEENLSMDGKAVQRAFLPLTQDKSGLKQTVAILNEQHLQCFGYYEGASQVSGDYFDYKKLDDRRYVLIKCDASGHGVPAALIMTVVATLFRRYYENWSYKMNGVDLNKLVAQINDFIESLGLKGKFATLILALIDIQSGDVHLCNAGDNIVHIFDSRSKKEIELTLQETPAAGPLATMLVEMKGGFKIERAHLNKGDFLFLYTDGIEESTRKFRSPEDYKVVKCEEEIDVKDGVHINHNVGAESEQMEAYRIQEIIEAVLNKKVYRLQKYHNPIPDEVLEFDFTTCTGTTEDVILAMASVEKVFRFYKDPAATENDMVQVDRRIDAFLQSHFNRYDYYCSTKNIDENDSVYLYYTGLREDEQLDDLTLLAVKIV